MSFKKKLIILEMANNHSGSLDHGKKIIQSYADICQNYNNNFEFVFKFQYRDLDSFIRKDMVGNLEIPLIKRFSETKLTESEFLNLIKCCRLNNFGVMVTPFDEISVEKAVQHDVDFLKIASCSFGDWPLMEKISKSGKKVVASCAGANFETVDQVVAFFLNRNIAFRLQHCVGEYPTIEDNLNVGQVKFLLEKYNNLEVGFSSHEDPSSTNIAPLALAIGATSFEKHVALETSSIKKNAYSTSPEEFNLWLSNLERSAKIIGKTNDRYSPSTKESESLRKLQRGVFASKNIPSGKEIEKSNIYLAFPPSDNQLTANDLSKYSKYKLNKEKLVNEPIFISDVVEENIRADVLEIAKDVCKLLRDSNLTVPNHADLEISHHYGIKNFRKFGLTMITVVNREYCKKILILLPGQAHPEQYHLIKEETFHVLYGEGTLKVNDEKYNLSEGKIYTILPSQRHYFESLNGLIIEEISSTHAKDDSYYTDQSIKNNQNRKTFLTHWRIS